MMPAVLCAALLHYLRSKKPIITSRGASDSLTSRALGVHKRERNLCFCTTRTAAHQARAPTALQFTGPAVSHARTRHTHRGKHCLTICCRVADFHLRACWIWPVSIQRTLSAAVSPLARFSWEPGSQACCSPNNRAVYVKHFHMAFVVLLLV